jgi:hypothetical protein
MADLITLRLNNEGLFHLGRQMRILILLAIAIASVGCATVAAPNFYNGHYYMSGDANCVQARTVSRTQIACLNAQGQVTGHRNAMTPQEIQMYQFQAMQEQMQIQQMQQSLAYNNAMMAANTQATLNRASVYSPPVVQPIQHPGGNQIRCIGVGIYANCRW